MSLFQQPLRVATQTPLKGSARRQLRDKVAKEFPHVSADQLGRLFPGKDEVRVLKLKQSRTLVYLDGVREQPLFIDPDGRGRLVPSVWALWRVPDLLPVLVVGAPVSRFLLRGADLMWPGVLQARSSPGLNTFLAGERRAVIVLGNPMPLAVGVMACSAREAAAAGGSGKALLVLHRYRDTLWDQYGGVDVPDGFGIKEVASLGVPAPLAARAVVAEAPSEWPELRIGGDTSAAASVNQNNAGDDGDQDDAGDDGDLQGVSQLGVKDDDQSDSDGHDGGDHGDDDGDSRDDIDDDAGNDIEIDADDDDDGDGDDDDDDDDDDASAKPTLDPEELMLWCFVEAARATKDRELPMLLSEFYARVLTARPAGTQVDVKATRWKKPGAMFKALAKEERLCAVKEPKPGVLQISALARTGHAVFTAERHVPRDLLEVQSGTRRAGAGEHEDDGGDAGDGDADDGDDDQTRPPLQVQMLFRPFEPLAPVFGELTQAQRKQRQLYTAEQARQMLWAYVVRAGAEDPADKSKVVVDDVLRHVFDKGHISIGDRVPKAELGQRFARRLSPWHVVTGLDVEPVVRKGAPQKIHISCVVRQGRKHMTFVANLQHWGLRPGKLVSVVRRRFAASATVQASECKTSGDVLAFQGQWVRETATLLHQRYGIPRTYLETVLDVKGGGKGGKKGGK